MTYGNRIFTERGERPAPGTSCPRFVYACNASPVSQSAGAAPGLETSGIAPPLEGLRASSRSSLFPPRRSRGGRKDREAFARSRSPTAGGLGFDDLRWSRELHRVLAPPVRTGQLDLINSHDPGDRSRSTASRSDQDVGGRHARHPRSMHAPVSCSRRPGKTEVAVVDPTRRRRARRSSPACPRLRPLDRADEVNPGSPSGAKSDRVLHARQGPLVFEGQITRRGRSRVVSFVAADAVRRVHSPLEEYENGPSRSRGTLRARALEELLHGFACASRSTRRAACLFFRRL